MTDQHLAIPYHIEILYASKMLSVPCNAHDRCLVFALHGSAQISCVHNGQANTFEVSEGNVFVMPALSLCGVSANDDFKLAIVWFHSNRINSFVGAFKHMSSYQALFSIYPALGLYQVLARRLQTEQALLEKVEGLLMEIESEYKAKAEGYQQIVNSTFFIIVTLISRHFGEQQTASGIAIHLAQAAAYMEDHCAEEITVAQLARMANVSARHFTRCFHQVYQTTPLQYLQFVRLQRACALLHEDSMTISEIAAECGFGDANYFSRIFRQHYQLSPSEYRKKYG